MWACLISHPPCWLPPGTSSWRRRNLRGGGGGTWVVDTKWIYLTIDPTKLKLLFLRCVFFSMIFSMFYLQSFNPWGDRILIWLGSHLFCKVRCFNHLDSTIYFAFSLTCATECHPKVLYTPWKWTYNLNIPPWKRRTHLQPTNHKSLGFHVSFLGFFLFSPLPNFSHPKFQAVLLAIPWRWFPRVRGTWFFFFRGFSWVKRLNL